MVKEEGKVTIVKRKLIRHRIGLSYPDIIKLDNQDAQQAINGTVQEEIYKMIIEQGYEEDYTKEIWGDYKVKLNKHNLFSLLIYINSYSKGAAHGLTALKAMTFDVQSGKNYELADLFINNSNYVNRINKVIKEEMVEKDIPLLVEFETIDKKQDFYLTKDALIVFFQLYEYTPYAYGIPEFTIPYSNLEDIINEIGPLKFVTANK